jgi:poly(A) polymerase
MLGWLKKCVLQVTGKNGGGADSKKNKSGTVKKSASRSRTRERSKPRDRDRSGSRSNATRRSAHPVAISPTEVQHHEQLRIIPRSEHGISRQHIDEAALKVLYRLNKAGFKACLVGGAVRDLLLRRVPKDFDIATDATPEEVNDLFRNSRLIGRRFKLVHVQFGRMVIEVATFRAAHDDSESARQNAEGRILRDNVYGDISEDVWRRDFTVNALYYDISNFSVIDFVGGMEDIEQKRLRLIGDPDMRYREDPVRMLRVVRFAAKLGFSIDESCRDFIYQEGGLLQDIPAARLYEEALKLFHSGHAVLSLQLLRDYNLLQYLFPSAVKYLDTDSVTEKFLQLAMESTDTRVQKELPITPAFLFAALLWAPLQKLTEERMADGLPYSVAIQKAATGLLSEQVRYVSIPKRFTTVMRDIWALQTRFGYRKGKRMQATLEHPKFRAGYDFLCLRARAGEPVAEDCEWWTRIQAGSTNTNAGVDMDNGAESDSRETKDGAARPKRRRRRRPPRS